MNHAPELLIARGFPPEAIQAIRTPGLGWAGPIIGRRSPMRIRGGIWRWNHTQSQWHVSVGGTLYHTLSTPGGAPSVTEVYPGTCTMAGYTEVWANYFDYVTATEKDPLGVFALDLPHVFHTFLFADSPQGARLVSVQRGKGKPREASAKLRGIVGASITGLMGCALADLPLRLPAGMWHTPLSVTLPVPVRTGNAPPHKAPARLYLATAPTPDTKEGEARGDLCKETFATRLSRFAADAVRVPLHPYHPRRLARFWPHNDCPEIIYYPGAPDV